MVAFLATSAPPAQATHFRYAHITWQPLGGNAARFTFTASFRRDGFVGTGVGGHPAVGDVINDPFTSWLEFGDGTSAPPGLGASSLRWKVTAIDVTHNWFVGLALEPGSSTKTTLDHTYSGPKNGANPWVARINDCCRLSDEVNNPDRGYTVSSTVDLTGGRSSIVSSMPPVVNVTCNNANGQFLVPASNPNPGDHTVFRFATTAEAAATNGPFVQPPGAHIDATTGLYTWNTIGALCNRTYSTQVIMEDRDAANVLKSQVAVDFILSTVVCPGGNQPPAFAAPTPDNGTTLIARVGHLFSATVSATDPNSGTDVILNSAGLPSGLDATPVLPVSGNPASADLSWTPALTDVGDHVVSFTATDPCGAQNLRSFTIRVVENHAPTAIAGPDTTVECASTGLTPVQLSGLRSTDPEGDPLTYSWSASGVTFDDASAAAPVGQFPHGSTIVSLTVSDGEFSSSTTQVVTVADTQPPILTLNGLNPMTIECHDGFPDPGATASDVCAGTVPVSVSGSVDPNTPGTYTLIYSANDGPDTAYVARTVVVVDTQPPVLTLLGPNPLTVECHGAFSDPGATAVDSCAGVRPVLVAGNVNPNAPGTYSVNYSAGGSGLDSAYATRTVVVVNTLPPVITLLGPNPLLVECHGTFTDPGATAHDACVGDVPVLVFGSVNPNAPGSYTLTYAAGDGSDSSYASRTVQVVDTTPPVVSLLGANPITVECHGTFTDPGATASDLCVGPLPVTRSGSVDPNTGGTYTLTYRATDGLNIGSVTRTVIVSDHTPPTISVSVSPTQLWPPNRKLTDIHATVRAGDACDPIVRITLTSITLTCGGAPWSPKDPSMPSVVGASLGSADFDFQLRAEKSPNGGCDPTYTIVYTATDAAGNTATGSATVRVPHDQSGNATAAGAGGAGPAGVGTVRSLSITIPSVVASSNSDGGGAEADLQLHTPTAAAGLVFDARTVDASQIWLGTSQGLAQPTSVQRADVNGDGVLDLVVIYGPAAMRGLATLPVLADDPITLYYRTGAGAGYEVEGLLGAGWQTKYLSDPGMARVRMPVEAGSQPAQAQALPTVTQLSAGAPNPARGAMTFALDLAGEAATRIEVYDLRGARVRTLLDGVQAAGRYVITWDGTNAHGDRVANGVYLVRAEAGAYRATRKAVYLK